MHLRDLIIFTILCSFTLHLNVHGASEYDCKFKEYYWRDYVDAIPKDALPGGINSNGKTTYIGQVAMEGDIVIAKIDSENKKAYLEWKRKEFTTNDKIRILCTQYPEQFQWINTTGLQVNSIKDSELLVGGYEMGVDTQIGRKQLPDELSIGKIIPDGPAAFLITTSEGNYFGHDNDFQVLAYDPCIKITKKEKKPVVETPNRDDENKGNEGNMGNAELESPGPMPGSHNNVFITVFNN